MVGYSIANHSRVSLCKLVMQRMTNALQWGYSWLHNYTHTYELLIQSLS